MEKYQGHASFNTVALSLVLFRFLPILIYVLILSNFVLLLLICF